MSLKGFHIVFIIFAVLCLAGFWVWTLLNRQSAVELNVVLLGKGSGVLAFLFFIYGVWFVARKSKTII